MEIALLVAGLALVGGLIQIVVSNELTRRREREAAERAAALAREADERRAKAAREADERRAKAEREARAAGRIQIPSFDEVREFGNVTGDIRYAPRSDRPMLGIPRRPIGVYFLVGGLVILLGVAAYLVISALT